MHNSGAIRAARTRRRVFIRLPASRGIGAPRDPEARTVSNTGSPGRPGDDVETLFEIRIGRCAGAYAAAAVTTCASSASRFDCER